MPKVLIAAGGLFEKEGPHVEALRGAGLEIVYPPRAGQLTEQDLIEKLKGVSATLAGMEPYTRRVFKESPSLRAIARIGVGYDAIDVPAATEHGVAVAITPGANDGSVAEHAFALLLALSREVVVQDKRVKANQWTHRSALPLRGRTLGIVGLGRVGKAMLTRALAFGMKPIAYELFPDKDFVSKHQVSLVPLDRLLAESDYVSLHLPMMADTKHTINKRTLALMKPSAFLINTGRGGLVCEADLVDALRSGRLAGAGLDVFETEPTFDNPLFALDNVVLTSHNAGTDTLALSDMALQAARAVVTLHSGDWPAKEVVNQDIRAKFRW